MKVVIDPDLCQGHLRCYSKAPELFGADEQGHGTAPRRELTTNAELDAARLAVSVCPELAIRIEE